jgi:hypothetical protein
MPGLQRTAMAFSRPDPGAANAAALRLLSVAFGPK